MRNFTITIPPEFNGLTIKFLLQNHFKLSARIITKLKHDNGILLNNKKEFVTKVVKTGDVLKITPFDKPSENIVPNNIPIDIIYEDEDILVVNKPPRMPTHPSINHFEGTLANAVMHYFGKSFTFRCITRLDRDTSGVVVIAKNAVSADRLSRQMRHGVIEKEYVALCSGIPYPESGRIDAPIRREAEGIMKRCISPDGKDAVTDYEVLEKYDSRSLVRLFPKTGRTHQLRLHLAHIGTPIFADFLYGTEILGERTRLHCQKVTLIHPETDKKISFTAPLPEDMQSFEF